MEAVPKWLRWMQREAPKSCGRSVCEHAVPQGEVLIEHVPRSRGRISKPATREDIRPAPAALSKQKFQLSALLEKNRVSVRVKGKARCRV